MRARAAVAMLGVALALLGCGAGSRSSPTGGAAIVIGDAAVAPAKVSHLMRIFAGGVMPGRGSRRYRALRARAGEHVILSTWLVEEARRDGIEFGARQVNAAIARERTAEFPGGKAEQQAFMRQTGETGEDIRQDAIAALARVALVERVLRSSYEVTKAQVRAYYQHHLHSYLTPERREIWLTNRKTAEGANRVKRRVANGTGFRSLAERNLQPLRPLRRGGRRGPLERAIFRAPLHRLVGPVFQRVDYYLFEVAKVVPSSQATLGQVEARIRRELTARARRLALAQFDRALLSRWTRATRCAPYYVVPGCSEYTGGRAISIRLSPNERLAI